MKDLINTRRPKLFRDPVHDVIAFDLNDPADNLLFNLISTRSFQRLRRIQQLGMAQVVYPGAEHSRFQHSIGVAHTARMIADKLGIDGDDKAEVLAAALLHDVGHGPFSHAIEHVTHVEHEDFTKGMISFPDSDIHQVLAAFRPDFPARISAYFEKRTFFPRDRQVLRDIVSSQLDADRMDYLQRDAVATGVKMGRFDFARIIAMVTSATIDGVSRLAINVRAREAVEGYLIARTHMFKQVYLHKTVRAAEKMLQTALALGRRRLEERPEEERLHHPAFAKLLKGITISPCEYVNLDDTDVWIAFKRWSECDDPELAELSNSLLNRRLYHAYNIDTSDDLSAGRLSERARSIAINLGRNPDTSVLVDYAQDTPYRPYTPQAVINPTHICLVDDDGAQIPIEDVSGMVQLLGRETYKITRLCVHPSISPRLQETIAVIGGIRRW